MAINRALLFKVSLDSLATFLVGLPFFLLYFIGDPYKRGFYCDDESIRYPFKESTISSRLLFSVSIISSLVVICTTEYMSLESFRLGNAGRQPMLQFVWILYHQLIIFAFGALSSQTLTDIAKYSIGRLRPHFIDVCRPDEAFNCGQNDFKYIENYVCQGKPGISKDLMRDARLSFMSGHSSFSAYCAVYIAIYLQNRVKNPKLALPRAFLQVLVIYLSIYTGFTRISDYKHHWSDVLVGLIQGTLVAALTTRYVAYLFKSSIIISGVGNNMNANSSVAENLQKDKRNFSTFEVEAGPV